MKAKTKQRLQKIAKWTGLGLLTSAVVAATGHHFGVWSIQPVYDFIKWSPEEFNWAAYGSMIAYFAGKAALDAIDNRRQYTQALQTSNLTRKLQSEAELKEKLDRNYENDLKTQEMLKAILDYEVEKSIAISKMEIAPDSIKELAKNKVEVLRESGLEIVDDIADTLIDKGLETATDFIEKQLKKL